MPVVTPKVENQTQVISEMPSVSLNQSSLVSTASQLKSDPDLVPPKDTLSSSTTSATNQSNATVATNTDAHQPPIPVTVSTSVNGAMQTPPFLTKLYQLVSDPSTAELVSWTDATGTSFTVHKPSDFGRDVLPKYFKHNNFSSFVRQLNQYGFHKQNPDKWMFGHERFRKDRPDLLKHITRRRPKNSTQVSVPPQQPVASTAVVAPSHTLSQNRAVVEIGKYGLEGLEGEVKALKRDKDLLIKELVVTRQAEEKLKDRCDSLEARMQSLEVTSKQMQAFIVHYFSQVLQPYSQAMASRKRKRLTSGTSDDAMDVDDTGTLQNNQTVITDGSNDATTMDVVKANSRGMPMGMGMGMGVGENPSMDALRMMLQQMGVKVGHAPSPTTHAHRRRPGSRARAIENGVANEDRPALTMDPATVLEIPEAASEDANGYADNSNTGNISPSLERALVTAAQAIADRRRLANVFGNSSNNNIPNAPATQFTDNDFSPSQFQNNGLQDVEATEIVDGKDVSLDFLDLGPSPSSSFTLDIMGNHRVDGLEANDRNTTSGTGKFGQGPLGIAAGGGRPMRAKMEDVNANRSNMNGADIDSLDDEVDENQNNGNNGDPDNCGEDDDENDDDDRAIEQLLDLDTTTLPPPLTHLPEGTDMQALARRIEGFSEDIS